MHGLRTATGAAFFRGDLLDRLTKRCHDQIGAGLAQCFHLAAFIVSQHPKAYENPHGR